MDSAYRSVEIIFFYQIYSLQLETIGAFKIIVLRSTSLNLGSSNLKLYADFKIGLNRENPVTVESVDPYFPFCETPCAIHKVCVYI